MNKTEALTEIIYLVLGWQPVPQSLIDILNKETIKSDRRCNK